MWIWIVIASIVLAVKPSRKNLFMLAGVMVVVSLGAYTYGLGTGIVPNAPGLLLVYLGFLLVQLLVFIAIGFVIIWLRGGSVEADAAKSDDLDEDLQRIRADIAARENQPPPA